MISAPPGPGQLVEVRRRQWVVTDVQASALISGNGADPQHLISLSSLDEDAVDEALQVVWEIEVGARVLETVGLPKIDGWDTCDRLEAFLDAVRWGATTSADRTHLQAPFRSGIEILDFQLDPLVRAIDMARVNLLIADDVGLGKTIEAGLVVQELLVRYRARSVIVVCPASLQIKWQSEMHDKFGLEFRIVNTEYLKALRRERGIHANPWTSFPRLIASVDWMKNGEGLRLIRDALPPRPTYPRQFDILIVDEAHNVAPAAASRYAMPSQRTRLIRSITPHFEHRLFLTATPHNGYKESFTALLELLDDQRFARGVMPGEDALNRVLVRRMKTDIVDEHGKPIYPKREIHQLTIEYTPKERETHKLLNEYIEHRSNYRKDGSYVFGTEFVHKLLKKRLFSSPRAFALTLAKHRETLSGKKLKVSKDSMDERILRKAILKAEEEYADDEQVEQAQAEAVEAASRLGEPLTEDQEEILDRLSSWAEMVKNRADSKARAILEWLENHLKTDGEYNDKRVILFTEYRATHAWLMELLASSGWGGERLMELHGGIDHEDREWIKAAFQAHPDDSPVRILLATDAASEGIDLQKHCNYLIHIEIPWNPNVMEQRNGRIDRHGQKEDTVHIWHPVGKVDELEAQSEELNSGDLEADHEFLMRAVMKVENIRQDLGSVGPVIAHQIEEAMLGKRSAMDTREAEAKASTSRRILAADRRLQEKIARLNERLRTTRDELGLTPERIARTVSVAMELAGKTSLSAKTLPFAPDSEVFEVPPLAGSWAQATHGLEHPFKGTRRPITFDHEVAKGRDDVVLAHLHHRLVQMSLRLLRAEVWAHEDIKKLNRVAIRMLPTGSIDSPSVVIWSRLVVTGESHHRLHEELTMTGGEIKEKAFARIRTLSQLEELMALGRPIEPSRELFDTLAVKFEGQESAILNAVEARSKERLQILLNTLDIRRRTEESHLKQVLEGLASMITKELEEAAKPTQLEIWPADQRDQLNRDLEALRARLRQIPEEREKEMALIRERYADPVARTFPVAVEFLVPENNLSNEGSA